MFGRPRANTEMVTKNIYSFILGKGGGGVKLNVLK